MADLTLPNLRIYALFSSNFNSKDSLGRGREREEKEKKEEGGGRTKRRNVIF